MSRPLTAIILAAGQGTRMKSTRAKVLHEVCGVAMVDHIVRAALEAGADDVVVVVGHEAESVTKSLHAAFGDRVRTVIQDRQLGTGHAVQCAMPALREDAEAALVLCGDTPLLWATDLARLRDCLRGSARLGMLVYSADDPTGYGRVLRDGDGNISGVREHKDCSESERAIVEVNPAVYIANVELLRSALGELNKDNAQGELYFTDIVEIGAKEGGVVGVEVTDPGSLIGVNDRAQLAAAEEEMYQRIADRLRRTGVTIRVGAHIDANVQVERDAVIEHGVSLRGTTRVGEGARIDVGCVLTDVRVAAHAFIKPYTVATESEIGVGAQIGPFSHLRPNSQIDEHAHVGNFVETKKTRLRKGAKANHLAYLGDGDIGEGANVGAGTIFCNYDGFKKHRTEIGAGAFIGSDSQIVAPVRIGDGAYVATGTTVTRDVPDGALAIGRVRQDNKDGYAERLKGRLKAAAGK